MEVEKTKRYIYVCEYTDQGHEIKLYSNKKVMAQNIKGLSYDSIIKHNWLNPYLYENYILQRKEIITEFSKLAVNNKPIEFKVDSGSIIDLQNVEKAVCNLADVSYIKNPDKSDLKTNAHNNIKNIRTFYIKSYYLVMNDGEMHNITDLLYKTSKMMTRGRGKYTGLYSIKNAYRRLQSFQGVYQPKDLYHAIKIYVNAAYAQDDYFIDNFKVESNIKIQS